MCLCSIQILSFYVYGTFDCFVFLEHLNTLRAKLCPSHHEGGLTQTEEFKGPWVQGLGVTLEGIKNIREYGGLEGNKVWKETLIKTIVKQVSSTFSSMQPKHPPLQLLVFRSSSFPSINISHPSIILIISIIIISIISIINLQHFQHPKVVKS